MQHTIRHTTTHGRRGTFAQDYDHVVLCASVSDGVTGLGDKYNPLEIRFNLSPDTDMDAERILVAAKEEILRLRPELTALTLDATLDDSDAIWGVEIPPRGGDEQAIHAVLKKAYAAESERVDNERQAARAALTAKRRPGRPPLPPEQRPERMQLYLAPHLRRWVDEHSAATGKSMNQIVEDAIAAAYAEYQVNRLADEQGRDIE